MKCLGIITARSGSKRIPRKNIVSLAGKPLMAWSIEQALRARHIERLVVSTDDTEIASVALGFGAEVPFLRPPELCRDNTPGIAPVIHAVEQLRSSERYLPNWVMLLQPTSPLRTAEDIDNACEIAERSAADAVVSVVQSREHPYWTKKISADGCLHDFLPFKDACERSQTLPDAYFLNGAIYLVRTEVLVTQRTFYPPNTFPYLMPKERSLDIDNPWDLILADLILGSSAAVVAMEAACPRMPNYS